MLKRFLCMLKQDIKIALRNKFHLVVILLAALMVIIINFAVPAEVKLTPNEMFYDASEGKVLEIYVLSQGIDKSRVFQSREELREEIKKNNNAIGVVMEGSLDAPKFTIIHQGMESAEILNLLDATIEETLDIIKGKVEKTNHRIEYLRPKAEPVPFNKSLVPAMLVTEAVMLGFLLIAVMIFQEKQEGSIRAYRITPGGVFEYILSKSFVNVLLALFYSAIVILFTIGFRADYLNLFITISLASFLMTLLGLSVSVFFKNLQEFLFVGVFIIGITGIPLVSYMTPSFAPEFITWIPSYSVLFSLREILFTTGKAGSIIFNNLLLAIEGMLFLAVSFITVNSKLMREGK